ISTSLGGPSHSHGSLSAGLSAIRPFALARRMASGNHGALGAKPHKSGPSLWRGGWLLETTGPWEQSRIRRQLRTAYRRYRTLWPRDAIGRIRSSDPRTSKAYPGMAYQIAAPPPSPLPPSRPLHS